MKYVIVAILAALLGAGLEFERGNSEISFAVSSVGMAYGCGDLAGKRYAIKTLDPNGKQTPELPGCAGYRKLYEAQ